MKYNYGRLIDYIKQKHFVAAFHLFKEIIKVKLRVKCSCPDSMEKSHKVQVVYWPRTAYYKKSYHEHGKGRDPNGPYAICEEGAKEATQYWNEMWAEYYSSVL